MKKNLPKQGAIYTAKQILEELNLKDSPFFRFHFNNEIQVIQTSHCSEEELLEVPGFAESRWRYERTTSEWIPLFMLDVDQDITEWVDMEPDNSPFVKNNRSMFVTPKGLIEEQYYRVEGEDVITSIGQVRYHRPMFDEQGERVYE